MRVVCAGHLNWDLTLVVDRLPEPDGEADIHERVESGGGSAANTAAGLVGLGCEATTLGSVGDDRVGERAIAEFREAGVDVRARVVDDEETTRKYIFVDEDAEVALFGTSGANEALSPEAVDPDVLSGADGLHLTGQHPETAARLAELATERDVPVSFDPGRRVADRDYAGALSHTDLLFATEREVAAVDADIPWCVTKHGADGATLVCPEGEFSHGGFAVDAVDSTGAGDAFAAGFLAVHLDGGDPERALEVGNACGAIAATTVGSRADLSWGAVRELAGT